MSINISSTYGIALIDFNRQNKKDFKVLYRKLIYQTLNHALAHLFVPSSVYKRGYERTESIDNIINLMDLGRESLEQLNNVETQIINEVKRTINADGHNGYGVYEISEQRTIRHTLFSAKLIGDYRILEWEQGRGKVLVDEPSDKDTLTDIFYDEVPLDDTLTINKPITPYSSHIDGLVKNTSINLLADINVYNKITSDYQERINDIEERIASEKYVSDEDLVFYELHNTRDDIT